MPSYFNQFISSAIPSSACSSDRGDFFMLWISGSLPLHTDIHLPKSNFFYPRLEVKNVISKWPDENGV
jgi:hypothetical protein